MCEIYAAKCEECGKQVPMHIADYCIKKKFVKVWCDKCLGKAPENATVYAVDDDECPPKVAVRVLDKDGYGIHPNVVSCCCKIIKGVEN